MTTTPMTQIVGQVFITTNYELFNSIDGNRNVNKMHLSRLKKSMSEKQLLSPILVNNLMQIIDGQHRFLVCKELKLPIYYIMAEGYGLNEVHMLNANAKNWNHDDYMMGYINMGKKEYIVYAEYKKRYKFGHNECIRLLSSSRNYGDGGGNAKNFHNGDFKIKGYKRACEIGDYIHKCLPLYEGSLRRSFINAITSLWDKDAFDAEYFLSQLEKNQSLMFDCPTSKLYLELIESVYNYRKRDKINLRY